MKFSIKKTDFLEGVSKVQGICGRKTSFPITSSVLVTAEKDSISVVSTDLEIGFQGQYPAQVEREGTVVIPGRKLFEIIKDFPSQDIICRELDNGWVEITNDNVNFQIVGMDPNDFPKLPDVSETGFSSLDAEIFRDMTEKTNLTGGITSEEKRPHLIGVLLEKFEKDKFTGLRMVATDGNRLAKVEQPFDQEDPEGFLEPDAGVIIPKKVMTEALKMAENPGMIELGVQGNYFVVKKEGEILIARLVEGEYPDYGAVIPEAIETYISLGKSTFFDTLRRMSILCSDRYRAVSFKVGKEKLVLEIINPEIGESRETIEAAFTGEPFEVSFNPRFFVDAITCMKSEQLTLRTENTDSACIVEGDKDPDYLSVIMPMRM